jgi:hypothetical protein
MRRRVADMRDRDIHRAALELLGDAAAGRRQQAQRRARRLAGKRPGQRPDQRNLGVFSHAGGEGRGARGRVEPGAEAQRRLDMLDRRGHELRDFPRSRGWLHAGRGAHEQLIAEKASEARQGMAHRGLREADPCRGPGHRALGHQRVERLQQVEVHRAYIHRANAYHTINRLDR